jgi:hypothetical protein
MEFLRYEYIFFVSFFFCGTGVCKAGALPLKHTSSPFTLVILEVGSRKLFA